MGRETTRREASPLASGMEVYFMEHESGTELESAVMRAIEAGVATAHRAFTRATRDDILEKAENMDHSWDDLMSELSEDGPAALIWYASLLDETLPPEQRLEYDAPDA